VKKSGSYKLKNPEIMLTSLCEQKRSGSYFYNSFNYKRKKGTPMTDMRSTASTRNSKFIKASPEALYRAFTDPAALPAWFAPGDMTGEIHSFDGRVGGGYQMSLYYSSSDKVSRGKSSEKEDRYTARFVELTPPKRIVQAITFESDDPAFSGEMTMEVTFEAEEEGTTVSILFKNIPPGIRPEDNETGTQLTLENLARYVASGAGRSD
jgi:uncharacterized protein YndB with AHSA1/START domain